MKLDQFWALQAMIEATIAQSQGKIDAREAAFAKALAFELLVDESAKAGKTYEMHGGK